MTTQQQRFKKTDFDIIQALLSVGKTKPLSQISVSDISRASGINRGTFYLHYLDKNDLVEQVTGNLVNQIQMILDKEMSQTMNYQFFSEHKPYAVIQSLVDLAEKNKELLHFLLSSNGDAKLYLTIKKIIQKAILKELQRVKGNDSFLANVPGKYAISLITNAIMTVITTWIEDDSELLKEEVTDLIMNALYLSPYDMLGIKDMK